MPSRLAPRGEWAAALVLLAAFAALCAHGLVWDSPTVDEFAHLPAGLHTLRSGDFALFPLNPPLVKVLTALPLLPLEPKLDLRGPIVHSGWFPWQYGTEFMERNRAEYRRLFFRGRLPVVALGVLLGALVWRWARALYGPEGGLLALGLYAFHPAFIAHAHLATVDVGLALFALLALYAFWRFTRRPGPGAALLCGVALGLAQLAKLTALLLYPALLLLAIWELARGRRFGLGSGGGTGAGWRGAAASLGAVAAIFAVSVLVLDAGYLFQGVGRPAGSFRFASAQMRALFALLPDGLRVPLPTAYLVGYDALQRINEAGEYPTYFFGRVRYGALPVYFPATLLLKTPLPLLAAWLFAPLADGGRRDGERFVWLPALVFLTVFCLLSQVHYGIRYVLPVVALGIVWAGRLAPHLARERRPVRFLAALVLAFYPLAALRATPDTIDYFNPLAGGRGDALLLDSNLDWGQGLQRLAAWMESEKVERVGLAYFGHADPALYGIRWQPPRRAGGPEWTAVSANFLHGLPYATYYWGRIVPVPAGAFTWLAAYPERRYLGGGLFLVRTGPSLTRGTRSSP
ncbi:MAG TPA: glycosyltransferase family 39 protein [Thermoanaerobaculia bacterium]|nr:glycosyltransferase family 39 protein [Thermoanaerobaculia bacterium]